MRSEIVEISKKQYLKYKQGEKVPEINDCFSSILDSLSPELKQEAKNKGFNLEEDSVSMEILTLRIVVPKASDGLAHALANEFIFCYLD